MNIMDSLFNGMGGSEYYRSLVFPELFPHEPKPRLENWSQQDLEMYCGRWELPEEREPTKAPVQEFDRAAFILDLVEKSYACGDK